MKPIYLICSYLSAIVVANLSVTYFGQWALPFTAVVFIPFDMVARDVLHETWSRHGRSGLFLRLGALVFSGAFISYLMNQNAKQIAIASCVTFTIASVVNTIIYQLLFKKTRIFKMNASNIVSSFVDSLLFPLIAFGIFDPRLFATQSIFKSVGGVLWAHILVKYLNRGKNDISEHKNL